MLILKSIFLWLSIYSSLIYLILCLKLSFDWSASLFFAIQSLVITVTIVLFFLI